MQVQDIERYLAELDQALVNQGLQTLIPVLLLGGAYILIQRINVRRTTNDIDVFPFIGAEKEYFQCQCF